MSERIDFESRLEARLRARAAGASRPFDAAGIARMVVASPGRRRGVVLDWSSLPRGLRWSLLAVALAAALIGVIAVGGPPRDQSPLPLAGGSNGWVAFALKGETRTSDSDIWVVRPGVAERPLIGFVGDNMKQECPSFSPDGTRLAYLEVPQIGANLVIVRFDPASTMAEELRVPVPGFWGACLQWSPDSRAVAYSTNRDGRVELRVTRRDGTSSDIFAWPAIEDPGGFDWSPGGTEIVAAVGSSLRLVPLNGGEPRVVYETDADVTLHRPRWSPDGTRIAVEASRPLGSLPLRIVAVDGRRAPIELADLGHPAWSPDGQRLAYAGGSNREIEVVVVTSEGRDPVVLSSDLGRLYPEVGAVIRALVWSPDGSQVLYISDYGGPPGLWTVGALGGGDPVALTRQPHIFEYTGAADLSWQRVLVPASP